MPELTTLVMGNGCFKSVGELKLIGLKKLEKVIIGEKCFTKDQGDRDYGYSSRNIKSDPNRQFCLKECDALKELKIGNGSFNDYSVFEIDSLNSLEVIEIGGFRGASLELKSHSQRMK